MNFAFPPFLWRPHSFLRSASFRRQGQCQGIKVLSLINAPDLTNSKAKSRNLCRPQNVLHSGTLTRRVIATLLADFYFGTLLLASSFLLPPSSGPLNHAALSYLTRSSEYSLPLFRVCIKVNLQTGEFTKPWNKPSPKPECSHVLDARQRTNL